MSILLLGDIKSKVLDKAIVSAQEVLAAGRSQEWITLSTDQLFLLGSPCCYATPGSVGRSVNMFMLRMSVTLNGLMTGCPSPSHQLNHHHKARLGCWCRHALDACILRAFVAIMAWGQHPVCSLRQLEHLRVLVPAPGFAGWFTLPPRLLPGDERIDGCTAVPTVACSCIERVQVPVYGARLDAGSPFCATQTA